MRCPCPVLNAAIAYSSHATTNNIAANAILIELLFCANKMILEVVVVHGNHVETAIISPFLQMGEIVQYERNFGGTESWRIYLFVLSNY